MSDLGSEIAAESAARRHGASGGERIAATMNARLLLIRHAEADTGPPPGVLCGWFDAPLSRKGERQLHAFAPPGSNDQPHVLYASPLRRAQRTAEALASAWGLSPLLEPGLREIHCGEFEGRRIEELKRDHPELWARNTAQADDAFAWPGGETYRDFRRRVFGALADIARRHPGQRVGVVTHSGPITQVIGALKGRAPAAWGHDRAAPFSATEVIWCGDAPERLRFFSVREWWRESPPHGG